MGSIKDFFIDGKGKLLIGCLSVIILLFFLNRWNQKRYEEAKHQVEVAQANLAAAQDTIRVTKAKNGVLEYNKLVYIASNNNLKALNLDLLKEIDATKGKIAVIEKVGFKVVHDTSYVPTTVYVSDSVISIRSQIDTTYSPGNFRSLAYESVYKEKEGKAFSVLTEDNIGFTATVGLKINEKKQYEIFVRPHYPNMSVVKLEGAVIEDNLIKKETKIPLVTIGGHIGWMPIAYDAGTKQTDFNLNRFGVGVGLNFNLAAMLKK